MADIITETDFLRLSADLRALASRMPLGWGSVQNNVADDQIDMFQIDTYQDLEQSIRLLDAASQDYLRRRWYLWRCSQCDEYLFAINPNVEHNPNKCDKMYDVRISGQLDLDIKGTVIPREYRDDADAAVSDPARIIEFYYRRQSTGRRYHVQNRLFVVHHSYVDYARELYLRCAWQSKREIYRIFCENIQKVRFFDYQGVKAAVIFVLERQRNKVDYIIPGL